MADDRDSFWFPGGAPFSCPMHPPLHQCHGSAPLLSPPPISGGGLDFLPPEAAALSTFQHELLSQPPYDLPGISGVGRQDSYSLEWGAPINSYFASSGSVEPFPLPADVAGGFCPFVEGAAQSNSGMANPICSIDGSSSIPTDTVSFPLVEEPALPCDSTVSQFNGHLLSSCGGGGAANFHPYSSAASFNGSPAISGSGSTASAFELKQEPFCYSSTMPLVENPPPISSKLGPTGPAVAATALGPPRGGSSERDGVDISLIWTAEEQRQLNELYRRYGHIECHVARLAKIARPFHGKSIRDVALRIKWMEEKSGQRMKAVNSLRSNRSVRTPGRSRDQVGTILSSSRKIQKPLITPELPTCMKEVAEMTPSPIWDISD